MQCGSLKFFKLIKWTSNSCRHQFQKAAFLVSSLIFMPQALSASPSPYQYDFTVCAIFQNEAKYLKEWIEYHRLVGAQHFYLYNNRSTDHYMDILQPYIDS